MAKYSRTQICRVGFGTVQLGTTVPCRIGRKLVINELFALVPEARDGYRIYTHWSNDYDCWAVSSGGLVVKHPALGAIGRRFEPRKRSKLFQGLISRLTTSWVADHVKWRCRLL